ncbi:alpha-glucosidase [Roseiarcus fermentans]|uniref:Alpha-glucosidase n=1 Tax=Roseiarcus fermentans TaxID=1473586 RepID=A0A366EIT3_9HYPH|nr:TIM-barrel domain-containing protein [Roseiarcus fermentans]RBP02327.1 alpha-glucosidase [Roseiarcus fermentans]
MKPILRARLAAADAQGVVLDCGDGAAMRIVALRDDLVRVTLLRGGTLRQTRTWSVPAHGEADTDWAGRDRLDDSSWPAVATDIAASPAQVTLATRALSLTVTLDPLRLDWALPDRTVFASDRETQPYWLGQGTHAFKHAMARAEGDRHYGLGDKTGPLDLTGRRLRCAMRDALGYDPERGDPLYKAWPFLIVRDGPSGVAHGLFYDNGAEGAFDLGCEHDNYFGRYRTYEAEDGDLDLYLILGPRLADVTRKFVALTGRTALPPRWSLGFAQTAMALADAPDAQARIEGVIDAARAHDIPVSAFHFGSGYTSIGGKRYVFTWNRAKFPAPEALIRAFHTAGMKVVANVKPCLLDDHPRYDEVAGLGAFVAGADGAPLRSRFWDGEGAHVDFTSPAGVAWWKESFTREVLDVGVDAGWNDNNEYGLFDDEATAAGFGQPTPLALLRPVEALLMTRATREAQVAAKPGVRPFTVSRAGGPGLQRYAQSWSGDNTTSWRSLKWNFRAGLGMALSGLYNIGHDIGGFAGPPPDPELLIRWTQAGVLHPRFLMNSWKADGVVTSPWLHPEALPAIRAALRLRLRLMPYLYSAMVSAHEAHVPVLAPTFFAFEDDPETFADADAAMFGPCLLAAPALRQGARAVEVYLPAGPESFRDVWTGRVYAAGRRATIPAPLDRLPLLAPAGAIVAVTDSGDDYARLHDEPSRALLVFPGGGEGSSRAVLVEDDGLSLAGPSTRVAVALGWTAKTVRVEVSANGDYRLPCSQMRVILPEDDRRRVELRGVDGIGLRI